jgi:fucose permease
VTAHHQPPKEVQIHRSGLALTTNACMFVFGVVLLLMGSLLPSLEVSYVQAGHLGSFPLAGILGATLLVGPALDILGAKPVLALALLLVAGALAVMPSLRTYPGLASAALAYGVGGGVLNTAANALVSDLHASGRGAALNLLGFSFSLGAVSAPVLMSSLGGSLSSTAVLRLLASAAALILIPVLILDFPPPACAGARIGKLLQVLNQPSVWLFGLLLFFESGSENCMFVWSSKMVDDLLRVGPERANLALVGLSSAMGAGRLLAVLWLRYLGSRNTLLISTATTVAGALIAYASSGFAAILAGIVMIGLGMSAIFPTVLGVAGDRFPGETGTVFGAMMAVALVGGMAGPTLGGRLFGGGPTRVLSIPVAAALAISILTVAVVSPTSKSLIKG